MSNIKIIKLISSEEIIADVDQGASVTLVSDPALIVYQRGEKGMGCGLAPYMAFTEGKIEINNHAIAAIAVPQQDLINEYNRIFGSGIVVASANDSLIKTQ
jgi:hypothetical protein